MIKIAVGCGKRDYGRDWFHVDGADFPHVSSHDITLPGWSEGTVDLIYASHLIAYFNIDEVKDLLKEWRKALKPGGIVRIATPNFRVLGGILRTNEFGDFEMKDIVGPLYGRMKMGDKEIYHKYCYDWGALRDLLYSVGFDPVREYNWRDTDHADIDDHSQAYLPKMDKENGICISLNVEATK